MRTASKNYGAYLTVYLSLVFAIILSLLLALIEGAAAGATRLQAELAADLGLDSVFAEYHRELLTQYGVFYIDDSYGNEKGGLSRTEQHLSEYIRYNCNPKADESVKLGQSFIGLSNPYLEIEKASFATDDAAAVWKAQAIECIKEDYGLSYIADVKDYIHVIEGNGLLSRDIMSEISQKKQEFEAGLNDSEEEIKETDIDSGGGCSYGQIKDSLGILQRIGVTQLIADNLSGQRVNTAEYISARSRAGVINQGCGLSEGIDKPDGIDDELLFGQYLMNYYGNYTQVKEQGLLQYQVEYILYGHDSDAQNLQAMVRRLLAMRAVSDFLTLNSAESDKKAEVMAICEVLCALILMPQLSQALAYIVLGIWAYIEAVADVKGLLAGYRIPLIKQKGQWSTQLWDIFRLTSIESIAPNQCNTGLSYEDHLRVFLAMMDRQDKLLRSLDIVEMDIRKTPGNEHFRIDQCISFLQVNFGFSDSAGREYVFTRKMGYQ